MNYDLPTLRDLLVRVEAATVPDRELDGRIWCLMGGLTFYRWDGAGVVWKVADGTIRHSASERIPLFTTSIDATVALIERELPDWAWSVARAESQGSAAVWATGSFDETLARVPLSNTPPALALIAAMLKALVAREEQNEQA